MEFGKKAGCNFLKMDGQSQFARPFFAEKRCLCSILEQVF